jgi:hypothetical protein
MIRVPAPAVLPKDFLAAVDWDIPMGSEAPASPDLLPVFETVLRVSFLRRGLGCCGLVRCLFEFLCHPSGELPLQRDSPHDKWGGHGDGHRIVGEGPGRPMEMSRTRPVKDLTQNDRHGGSNVGDAGSAGDSGPSREPACVLFGVAEGPACKPSRRPRGSMLNFTGPRKPG